MRRSTRRALGVAVFLVAGGLVVWALWWTGGEPRADRSDKAATRPAEGARDPKPVPLPGRVSTAPATRTAGDPVARAEALKALARGEVLRRAGKLVEARTVLAKTYASGQLNDAETGKVRAALTDLAAKTLFSPTVHEGDPYTFAYTVKPGEVLVRVERKLGLHVPWQLLLKINGIRRAENIRAGQTLKMIRGPFHAVVTKSTFTMDLFLDDVFVQRCKVCIGADETPTPTGQFRVTPGGKLENAAYTPPPSSGRPQKAILPGQPGYPLDRKGLWISLTGIREKGTMYVKADGYGIHGTNDPTSIGKAESFGCIRLADKDIGGVFSMLYEKWSSVTVRP